MGKFSGRALRGRQNFHTRLQYFFNQRDILGLAEKFIKAYQLNHTPDSLCEMLDIESFIEQRNAETLPPAKSYSIIHITEEEVGKKKESLKEEFERQQRKFNKKFQTIRTEGPSEPQPH